MSWVVSCAVIGSGVKRVGQGRWGEHQGADWELRELSEGRRDWGVVRAAEAGEVESGAGEDEGDEDEDEDDRGATMTKTGSNCEDWRRG